jgi:CheY-like chemotaxis protein
MNPILIVEDEAQFAELVAQMLRQLGLEIIHCYSAAEAFDYLETNNPSLIVLDIGLPGMSGWEFLDTIKQDEILRTIPVIVTTAYSDPANRLIGKLQDIDRYLTKPFKPQEIRDIVTQLLNL